MLTARIGLGVVGAHLIGAADRNGPDHQPATAVIEPGGFAAFDE